MTPLRCIATTGLRGGLSLIFAYAAITKLADPASLHADIQSYRLLPEVVALPLAYFIPALEIVIALALWVSRYRQSATGILAVLMAIFTAAIAISWLRGLDISCGCFGESRSPQTNYPYLIGRDLLLLAIAGFLIYSERWHTAQTAG